MSDNVTFRILEQGIARPPRSRLTQRLSLAKVLSTTFLAFVFGAVSPSSQAEMPFVVDNISLTSHLIREDRCPLRDLACQNPFKHLSGDILSRFTESLKKAGINVLLRPPGEGEYASLRIRHESTNENNKSCKVTASINFSRTERKARSLSGTFYFRTKMPDALPTNPQDRAWFLARETPQEKSRRETRDRNARERVASECLNSITSRIAKETSTFAVPH